MSHDDSLMYQRCMEEPPKPVSPLAQQIQELSGRIEKIEKMNQACIDANPIKDIYHRFQMLETHINKLYDATNLDDRITGKDVLSRIAIVEKDLNHVPSFGYVDRMKEDIEKIESFIYGEGDISALIGMVDNMNKNWGHVSHQVDRLEEQINTMTSMPNVYWAKYNKTPHKCPVCEGSGKGEKYADIMIDGVVLNSNYHVCISCEGKGIVWG